MSAKIQAAGIDMAVAQWGTGTPLVFVHGFPFDGGMWSGQLQAFAGLHQVIVPDLRGFGDSTATPGEVTMERFADDLAELLDALQVEAPIVLCGLSMGGYIALAFWHRHRERIRALILSDTRATADTPEAAEGRRATADRVEREGPAALVEQMLPKLLSPRTLRERPDVEKRLRTMMLAQSPTGIAAAARGLARRADWTGHLAQIDMPVLVIAGSDDAITPPQEMKSMAAALPAAKYVELSGAGHVPPLEVPREFDAEVTAFLRSLD